MERAGRSGRSGRRCRPLVSHGTTRGPRLQGLGELLDREIARDARAGIVDQVRRAKGVTGDANLPKGEAVAARRQENGQVLVKPKHYRSEERRVGKECRS